MPDTKISNLPAATSILTTDILPVVTDPGGSPVTKKITLLNFIRSSQLGSSGTSNPAGAVAGQQFYRTDLGWSIYYDGTRWLTKHDYSVYFDCAAITVNGAVNAYRHRNDFAPYVLRLAFSTSVATTNNGTNFWSITFWEQDPTFTSSTALLVASTGTTPDPITVWVDHESNPATALPANHGAFMFSVSKTLTPGAISIRGTMYFKLVIP